MNIYYLTLTALKGVGIKTTNLLKKKKLIIFFDLLMEVAKILY